MSEEIVEVRTQRISQLPITESISDKDSLVANVGGVTKTVKKKHLLNEVNARLDIIIQDVENAENDRKDAEALMVAEIEEIKSSLDNIATVVNNGDELNKAINEGKKYILIKEGTHNIGTLTIKNPQTIIKGKGIRDTVLIGNIIVPLSCHNTVIEDLRLDSNGFDVGIDLGNGGTNQVQDVGYIINKVRIVNSKIGVTVNESVRGCNFNNIIVGNCETGYMIKGTDNEFISCICGSIAYHGFEILASNNRFVSCKSFCCGTSNKYGSGYYINSSFHIFSACESQQNRFENLVMYNAYGCLIQITSDGAGWGSSDNMEYNNTYLGYGTIPISSILVHNIQNCKLDITIINGREVSGELWKCSKGIYSKYPLTCKENIINILTRNNRNDFSVFDVGDIYRFTTSNNIKVDNIDYNSFYGHSLDSFIINNERSDTLTMTHDGTNVTNVIKEVKVPKETKKLSMYFKKIDFSNIDNSALNLIIMVVGKDENDTTQYKTTGVTSFNDRNQHTFDLTSYVNQLKTVEEVIIKVHLKPKEANNIPITVTLSNPKFNCYY